MKININNDWLFWKEGDKNKSKIVSLPHDAMLEETRSNDNPGGANISYFGGGKYYYEKKLNLSSSYLNKIFILEFCGIYQQASIFINGIKVGFRAYGYTDFYIDITKYISNDSDNILRVEADNSKQPNSRWYTGSGIYRDVNLYVKENKHILIDGVKVKTLDYNKRKININVKTSCEGKLDIDILFKGKVVISKRGLKTNGELDVQIESDELKLWSVDNPNLYSCKVCFEQDSTMVNFGIRQVELNLEKGLLINGERVILRGACIHSDNGIIGAADYRFANFRKIKILKDAGYNAIRSAHNPCSKHILDACDQLGVLVMDEYVDCWYVHKTKYDYVDFLKDNWKQDLFEMVEKDYNHPSVILYSTGNEVAETSQSKGIKMTKEFTDYLHQLDNTRFVTCGINIFFNYLFRLGFGVYTDKKSNNVSKKKNNKKVGSEFFNNLAGILGAGFMKFGASLHGSDVSTRRAYDNMDVAGYNYGINRYRHDLKKYPRRFILGSETFCADANRFYELAKDNPRIVGDFVWAGMDYLGEAGIGSWVVKDYTDDFDHKAGWISAGSGRVDLTGKITSEGDFTRVCFDLDTVKIGVVPVRHYKMKRSSSAWKFSMAEASWNYPGYEGKKTQVEVYAKAGIIKLFLNDKCVGKKRVKQSGKTIFKVKYYPGKLTAKVYDKKMRCLGEDTVMTGEGKTVLAAVPEQKSVKEGDLIYIRYKITDSSGLTQTLDIQNVTIDSINRGKLLAFGNGCAYNKEGYLNRTSKTYLGECLAVIKPDGSGNVEVNASSIYGKKKTLIIVKKQ
ncbi:MAG: DUF4982 domain-containing protein [Bacteroides sp.]|nr:DUF4982 domain-containing protein [Bacteroides sp.]